MGFGLRLLRLIAYCLFALTPATRVHADCETDFTQYLPPIPSAANQIATSFAPDPNSACKNVNAAEVEKFVDTQYYPNRVLDGKLAADAVACSSLKEMAFKKDADGKFTNEKRWDEDEDFWRDDMSCFPKDGVIARGVAKAFDCSLMDRLKKGFR